MSTIQNAINNRLTQGILTDYTETIATSTQAAAYTINLANGNWHEVTMTGNVAFSFSNVPSTSGQGVSLTLTLIQDATGSRIPSFAGSVDWGTIGAPTFSTAANAKDVVVMITADNGTTWRAFLAGKGF